MISIPRGVADAKRCRNILSVSVKYGFSDLIGHKKTKKKISAQNLRLAMEELGGAFIKLGQLISLRPDLVPIKYCREFSKLQDHVKPFSDITAKQTLHKELKHSSKSIKLGKLIASGSIGQVYAAEINDHKVAIKIMRPDIEKVMRTDLDLMYYLAQLLKKKIKSDIIDPMEIFEQFRMYTENELDYNVEAKNIEGFYENFLKTHIIIPNVHSQFSTKRVLTMDFIDGTNLLKKRLTKPEKRVFGKDLANSMFKQVFIDGLFHADPHPGNIFITDNKKLAFLDFGIVGKLSEKLKKSLSDLFIALISKDLDGVVDAFIDMNLVSYKVDRAVLKEDVSAIMGKYFDNELWATSLSELVFSTIHTAKRNNIKLPKDYVLLGKAFVTMEGVGKQLYPEYSLAKEAKPFVKELVLSKYDFKKVFGDVRRSTPKLAKFIMDVPQKTNYFLSELDLLEDRLLNIEKDARKLQTVISHGTNRLVMGIVIAALLISFAIVLPVNGTYAFVILLIALALLVDVAYTSVMDRIKFK
ncbi:MAG: hypothetical protein KKG59_04680 [Nanoarchaeota archaeon]|nr:hypothetical protein [Nanoarchaeota archaeon]